MPLLKKTSTFLLLFVFITSSYYSQITEKERTMIWTTLGLSKKINKKLSLTYYQLNSFDAAKSRFNFIQPDFGISYKIIKPLSITLIYTPTLSLDTIQGNQLFYNRISGSIKLKTKISKRIRMENSFTAQHFFTQRSKFQQRYYYKLDLYYRNTKWPWRLRPFLNQKLYWYSNGRLLQYYDSNKKRTIKVSPNGLHAYRFQPGVKFYPIDNFMFSIYYLKQIEFNTTLFGSLDINDYNPRSKKIRRSFYDFSVIGISFIYKL